MPDDLQETNAVGPLTTTVGQMCAALGVGASTGWALLGGDTPEIESITIGRRRLVVVESIRAYVERRRAAPRQKVAHPPPGAGRKHHRANRQISHHT